MYRARGEPGAGECHQLGLGPRDTGARAPKDEARPDHDRKTDRVADLDRLIEVVREARHRALEPYLGHRLLEELAILCGPDRFGAGADQLDAELLQRP